MKFWQVLILLGLSASLFVGWAIAFHYDNKDKGNDREE